MMAINGINGTNAQVGAMKMTHATDSVSKNIQNQIANAQKQLQELSSNKDMSLEEKMKKRQEIQQQITDLNNQLRQHQAEQRKEKQQAKGSSMDDMLGSSKKTATKAGKQSAELSQASMKAMISADSAMSQAQVQGSVATKMEGRAGVLESEIKMDKGRGASTEAKEAELAELEQKAAVATSSQMNILATANKEMEEAAKADQQTTKTDDKTQKTEKNEEGMENRETKVSGADANNQTADVSNESVEVVATDGTAEAVSAPEQTIYTHVDVRL